ncbi:hypothetical protein NIES593_10960 [Hydrococcus rivularis NIES-593]|uniref:Uncharacterized protein n=1 Tax=Hydrococcus rivularis NIES-593 TaxID=1921803 RepID=A0A1U7HHC0_9CYAN|nr:hypothetical protein [Hydrococcus rivularis]OKH22980.1 hypothetical protein NIES593_10960 [Hydrococcus rivularis NIES-593]
MTGKVLENGTAGVLVLILPIAVALVVIFTAWPLLLLLIALSIGLKIWDNYQWQQWCKQVNPFFTQLIKENQGALTVMDLSLKANLTGRAAKRFLERKAEEYGAQRKDYKEKGTVYYFLTVSALGSIFDDSDTISDEEEEEPLASRKTTSQLISAPEKPSFSAIAQLANQKEKEATQPPAEEITTQAQAAIESASVAEKEPAAEPATIEESGAPKREESRLALIQADLAKRLDINASTVARRKSSPDFPEWSQSKDPEGIAWKYVPETQMFVPADE